MRMFREKKSYFFANFWSSPSVGYKPVCGLVARLCSFFLTDFYFCWALLLKLSWMVKSLNQPLYLWENNLREKFLFEYFIPRLQPPHTGTPAFPTHPTSWCPCRTSVVLPRRASVRPSVRWSEHSVEIVPTQLSPAVPRTTDLQLLFELWVQNHSETPSAVIQSFDHPQHSMHFLPVRDNISASEGAEI